MEVTEAATAFWGDLFAGLRPPPQLTVDQWADKYRVIAPEFAAAPGAWRTDRVSCMRAVMRACSPSHPCRRVVLVKPAQAGGTEAAVLNPIGHTIDVNPRSMIVTFPTIDLAEAFSRERLDPMIAHSPRLRGKVADVLPASSAKGLDRSSVKRKRYPGGFLILTGANSSAGLSSRPVPMIIIDEVDECVRYSTGAGDPVSLLDARTTTFHDAKQILVSSPSNEPGETSIVQFWEDSTRGKLETECPGCGHWQVLDFARMDLATAQLACAACGDYFGQSAWLRGGETERWAFENPAHPTCAGFWLNGLNSPWLNWRINFCAEFREAERVAKLGDDSLARVFTNARLAQPYTKLGKRVEVDLYEDRREPYEAHERDAELPDGALVLTAAVDVQDTYLAYEVVAWGKGRESWGIETGEFHGNPHLLPDPNRPNSSPWEQIDRFVYNRIFRFPDGRVARVRACFVDSGGHATTSVYKYCKPRQPRIMAIKGQGGTDRAMIIGGKLRERSEGCWLLRLGVDTLKDELHARLAVGDPGPGYCHWPCGPNGEDMQGYNEGYFKQLVAEQRVLKYTSGGFAKFEWHKNRTDANEAFDLRCYARAALEYLRVRLETMTPDIIRSVTAEQFERLEVGFGRHILVDRSKMHRAGEAGPQRGAHGASLPPDEPEQSMSAQRPPIVLSRPRGPRWGAGGNLF
jgi:phage terminase large subunit GpA-like protein